MPAETDLKFIVEELRALRGEVQALRKENEALRSVAETGVVARAEETASPARISRRGLFASVPAITLAACGGGKADSGGKDSGPNDGPADVPDGSACDCLTAEEYVKKVMAFDLPVASPQVIDSSINWQRKHEDPGPGYVSNILTLEQEGNGPNSYPWPLFVKVTGTPDPAATMGSANAFAINARLINEGPGFGAAYFADLQHKGNGTDIGYDFELVQTGSAGRSIALNILNAGDVPNTEATNHNGSQAINIQTGPGNRGWDTAIMLEKNPATNAAGGRGIAIEGQYNLGLDLAGNNMKVNSGSKIFLDTNQTLYLWYNPANSHIEFRYLGNVLGYLKLDSVEHEM